MTGPAPPAAGSWVTVPAVGPLDAAAMLRWLSAHTTAGVDEVVAGAYRRTTDDGVLVVRPTSTVPTSTLPTPAGGPAVAAAVEVRVDGPRSPRRPTATEVDRVRSLFDLDRDLQDVERSLGRDDVLGRLVAARSGLRVMGAWSPWEALVRVVVGQQVSVAGARTLAGRVARAAGHEVPGGRPGLDLAFPDPAELLAADLGPVGLTGARRRTLTALASAVVEGRVTLDPAGHPAGGPGWLADLAAVPGIGPWTLSYLAMRVLHDGDAWPAGDLVLRRACQRYGLDAGSGADHLRPWRAYAATHLWEATWGAPR